MLIFEHSYLIQTLLYLPNSAPCMAIEKEEDLTNTFCTKYPLITKKKKVSFEHVFFKTVEKCVPMNIFHVPLYSCYM